MAQPWLIRSEMQPAFEGGFIQSKYLIGGIFTVRNKAQRNAIHFLNRKLDATTTTLVVVTDENRIYKLVTNPTSTYTTDTNWEVFYIGQSSSFRPVGTWDADNDVLVLTDADALNRNGEFYFVSDAETQRTIQYDDLFGGATVDVVNGDLVVSIGDRWTVITSTVQWDALAKPSVIDDYVDGIVIAHTHLMSDITDLAAAMALKYDIGDTADHTIDFEDVPDTAIVEVEFLRQFYYTKDEMNDLVDTVTGFWPLQGSAALTNSLIMTSVYDLTIATSQDLGLGGSTISLVTDDLYLNPTIDNNDALTRILVMDGTTGKVQYRSGTTFGWPLSGSANITGNVTIDADVDGTRSVAIGGIRRLDAYYVYADEVAFNGFDTLSLSVASSTVNLIEGRLTATLDVNNYIDLYASTNQLALGARTIRGVGENLNLGDRANYSTYNLVGTNGLNDARDGMNLLIQGGNGYLIAGDGNGGNVTIKSGVRRVAGAGVDGDIHIDTGTGGGLYLDQTPANDDALTQVLVRDTSTGQLKYRSVASIEGTPGAYWKAIGNTNIEGDVSISSDTLDGHNLVYGLVRFAGIFSNAVLIKEASDTHQIETDSFELLTEPPNDDALTQVLVRDGSTGEVKYRDASTFGSLIAPEWEASSSNGKNTLLLSDGFDIVSLTHEGTTRTSFIQLDDTFTRFSNVAVSFATNPSCSIELSSTGIEFQTTTAFGPVKQVSIGNSGEMGFFGVTAVAKQTSGANLTNNVTVGGTNNQIDDWTNLTTYATDAAAIRNAIYQLSRKLKQVNDGLRAYGLLT